MKRQRGFSLIEVLIASVIIGIVAAGALSVIAAVTRERMKLEAATETARAERLRLERAVSCARGVEKDCSKR